MFHTAGQPRELAKQVWQATLAELEQGPGGRIAAWGAELLHRMSHDAVEAQTGFKVGVLCWLVTWLPCELLQLEELEQGDCISCVCSKVGAALYACEPACMHVSRHACM